MALETLITVVEANTKMAKSSLELDAAKDEARYRRILVDSMVDDKAFEMLSKRFERLKQAKEALTSIGAAWTPEQEKQLVAAAMEMAEAAMKGNTTK